MRWTLRAHWTGNPEYHESCFSSLSAPQHTRHPKSAPQGRDSPPLAIDLGNIGQAVWLLLSQASKCHNVEFTAG